MPIQFQSLPPEIHTHLLSFACSSPSLTFSSPTPAHTLSLLSRYWHALALPFRFSVISITASSSPTSSYTDTLAARLSRLTEALEAAPPHHRRRVHHLFISDRCRAYANKLDNEGMETETDVEEPLDQYDSDVSTAHLRLLTRLLTLTSPTLHTLTLHIHNPYTSTPFLSRVWLTHFPALESLTISGVYPLPVSVSLSLSLPASFDGRDYHDRDAPPTPIPMPRLTRLHLHGMRNPSGLFELGGLESVCPRLERLRVSGVSAAKSFAEEVGRAVKARRAENELRGRAGAGVDIGVVQRGDENRSLNRGEIEKIRGGNDDDVSSDTPIRENSGTTSFDDVDHPFNFPSPFTPRLPSNLSHLTLTIPPHTSLPPRCGARFKRMHAEMVTLLETLPSASEDGNEEEKEKDRLRVGGNRGVEVRIVQETADDAMWDGLQMVRRMWAGDEDEGV